MLHHLIVSHVARLALGRTAARAGVLIAGGLAPTAMAAGVFAVAGHLGAFIQANVFANLAYVEMAPDLHTLLVRIHAGLQPLHGLLLAFAGCLAILPWRVGSRAWPGLLPVWLTVWLLAAALDVSAPLEFWSHYFLALVPPLCVAASLVLRRLQDWSHPRLGAALAAGVACVLLVPPGRSALFNLALAARRSRTDTPRRVADDIMRLGPRGGVYVFDYQPIIYFLTGAKPPIRYVHPAELAQFSASSGANPLLEIKAAMAKHPRFVVTADPPLVNFPRDILSEMSAELLSYHRVAQYVDANDGSKVSLLVANPVRENVAGPARSSTAEDCRTRPRSIAADGHS